VNPYSSLSSHVAPPIAFAVTSTLVALSAALHMLSSKTWSMFVTCPGSSGFVSIASSNALSSPLCSRSTAVMSMGTSPSFRTSMVYVSRCTHDTRPHPSKRRAPNLSPSRSSSSPDVSMTLRCNLFPSGEIIVQSVFSESALPSGWLIATVPPGITVLGSTSNGSPSPVKHSTVTGSSTRSAKSSHVAASPWRLLPHLQSQSW
jgi:hypothetical protein